jgi:predicted DNA-binding protein
MSDAATLSRTRTVRLSAQTDRQIEAVASRKAKTASDVIRETLEAEFSTSRETPGQWLLRTAGLPRNRKPDAKFSSAYRQRHR